MFGGRCMLSSLPLNQQIHATNTINIISARDESGFTLSLIKHACSPPSGVLTHYNVTVTDPLVDYSIYTTIIYMYDLSTYLKLSVSVSQTND